MRPAEIEAAVKLARYLYDNPGTPCPSPATNGKDSDELSALYQEALLALASRVERLEEVAEAAGNHVDCIKGMRAALDGTSDDRRNLGAVMARTQRELVAAVDALTALGAGKEQP